MNADRTKEIHQLALTTRDTEEKILNELNILHNYGITLLKISISTQWTKIMDDCRNNLLPYGMIDSDTLQKDIMELRSNISIHNQELSIPVNDLQTLYQLPITHCTFSLKNGKFYS